MILKLTQEANDAVCLVDTTGLLVLPFKSNGVKHTTIELTTLQTGTRFFNVKETIEEIEQQIKNGGVCGSFN